MEDKNIPPLIIFPEGGTTNGKYIIKFKKGAFVSLLPIWPKVIKYKSIFQSPSTGVADGFAHYFVAGCIPFSSVEKIELPIFAPNEFFYKNHQKEGEERWMTYSRVLRDIMAETGGLELSS